MVIDPLFLDDLKAEFKEICAIVQPRTKRNRLDAFQKKLASIYCPEKQDARDTDLPAAYYIYTDEVGTGVLIDTTVYCPRRNTHRPL